MGLSSSLLLCCLCVHVVLPAAMPDVWHVLGGAAVSHLSTTGKDNRKQPVLTTKHAFEHCINFQKIDIQ